MKRRLLAFAFACMTGVAAERDFNGSWDIRVNEQIEGLAAIASDPDEAEPGALILQGDHGPVEFRHIMLTRLVKNNT